MSKRYLVGGEKHSVNGRLLNSSVIALARSIPLLGTSARHMYIYLPDKKRFPIYTEDVFKEAEKRLPLETDSPWVDIIFPPNRRKNDSGKWEVREGSQYFIRLDQIRSIVEAPIPISAEEVWMETDEGFKWVPASRLGEYCAKVDTGHGYLVNTIESVDALEKRFELVWKHWEFEQEQVFEKKVAKAVAKMAMNESEKKPEPPVAPAAGEAGEN